MNVLIQTPKLFEEAYLIIMLRPIGAEHQSKIFPKQGKFISFPLACNIEKKIKNIPIRSYLVDVTGFAGFTVWPETECQ